MKKTRVSQICLFLDFKSDESYTPSKLSIKGGMHMQDLKVRFLHAGDPPHRPERAPGLVHLSLDHQAVERV